MVLDELQCAEREPVVIRAQARGGIQDVLPAQDEVQYAEPVQGETRAVAPVLTPNEMAPECESPV